MFIDILLFHEFTMKLGLLVLLCQRDSYWNQVNFLMTPFPTLSHWSKVLVQIAWYVLQACVHYSNFSCQEYVQLMSSLRPSLGAHRNRVKTSRNLMQLRFLEYSSILHPCPVPLTLGGFGTGSCPLTHLQGLLVFHARRPKFRTSELLIKLNWCFSATCNVQN